MLRKVVFSLIFFLSLTQNATAASVHDGIWHVPSLGSFFSVQEKNGQVEIVSLDSDMGGWDVFLGTLSGNLMSFDNVGGTAIAHAESIFTSNTTLEFHMTTCQPYDFECPQLYETLTANMIG